MKDKDKIILVGDIHGYFARFANNIRQNLEDAYIIQVGDFGVVNKNPGEQQELTWLNNALHAKNCVLYAIRGNHDNPERFNNANPYNLENIILLKDYSELNLLGKSILLVGGAFSIDRFERTAEVDYWKDENFVYDSAFSYKEYDLVVTHSRPSVINFHKGFRSLQYYIDKDDQLMADLISEGEEVSKLYESTKPKNWIFGHYHRSGLIAHENTTFRCLDIGEMYQYACTSLPFS